MSTFCQLIWYNGIVVTKWTVVKDFKREEPDPPNILPICGKGVVIFDSDKRFDQGIKHQFMNIDKVEYLTEQMLVELIAEKFEDLV